MNIKPSYELYCLYHKEFDAVDYGNQADQVVFVKMDDGPFIYPSKKHIFLHKEEWFHPIGKEWGEYQFYYSLYQGYKKGLIELPEYMGFIHYDMDFYGKEYHLKDKTIIDFINELISKDKLNKKTLISFQPFSFRDIYNQNYILDRNRPDVRFDLLYENCLTTILNECNSFLNQHKTIESIEDSNLNMCSAFFIHKSVFIKLMEFISTVIEDGRLSIFDKKIKYQGGMAERYSSIFLEFLDLNVINFVIEHDFVFSQKDYLRINLKKKYDVLKKYTKLKVSNIFNLKNKIHDDFCILLTATIDPNGCNFLERSDPKIREKDYIKSLKLWLKKTKFKIVFCENSKYDLKNIKVLCQKYPQRVEIIQFNGNDYPREFGKGYGEYLIIEKALKDSIFIKNSKTIIKVTGRIFIKNIYKIVINYSNSIVEFAINNGVYSTMIFIFKKDFFTYLKKYKDEINDSKSVYFEKIFEKSVKDLQRSGYNNSIITDKVEYFGYSGTFNIKYSDMVGVKNNFKLIAINFVGKMGVFIRKNFSFLYKILKPFFPDIK